MRIQVVPIEDFDKLEAENATLRSRLAEAENVIGGLRTSVPECKAYWRKHHAPDSAGDALRELPIK